MEVLYVIVGVVTGAVAKWVFDRMATRDRDKKASFEQVVAARHTALEAGQALQMQMQMPSDTDRDVLLAAAQAVSRLCALGDVRGATRVMNWLLAMQLRTEDDQAVDAQTDFVLHINDPVT